MTYSIKIILLNQAYHYLHKIKVNIKIIYLKLESLPFVQARAPKARFLNPE